MSALLLTPRRQMCGAVYEQLMNKKFQQGFSALKQPPAATAARHVWRKRLANFRQTVVV
jgi:hypothetical protein